MPTDPMQRFMTRRQGLANMLMQQEQAAPPIQSHTQGLASLLRQGLAGYMQGQDSRDRSQAYKTMMEGLSAQPWVNPDTGQVSDAPAGGYAGAEAALAGVPDNEYADQLGPQMTMQRFARDQALADQARQFQQQMTIEEMKRQTGLEDVAARLGLQSELATQRDVSKEQRDLARQYAEFGFTPPGGAMPPPQGPTQGQMTPAGPMAAQPPMGQPGAAQPRTMAEAKAQAAAREAEMKAESAAIGKATGEEKTALAAAEASFPRLQKSVETLKELGKTATYTMGGQAADFLTKETGFGATEGSIARSKYIAHVKNNVLPLLRETFGAAFTAAEGESLLATLGDPDSAPEQKNAVLDAFIADKKANLEVKRRRVGGAPQPHGMTGGDDDLLNMYAPR